MELKLGEKTLVVAAVVAATAIGLAGLNAYLAAGGDNAGYIAEAESLLQLGRRVNLYEAGTPPATTKPPLFPVMLAGVEKVFGRSIVAMKIMLVLCSAAAVLAAWWLLRASLREKTAAVDEPARRLAALTAAGLAVWFALTPTLGCYTHDILADVPFTAAALAALACLARSMAPDASRLSFAGLIIALLAASALRSAGVIVAGACVCYLLLEAWLRRELRGRLAVYAAVVLLVVIGIAISVQSSGGLYFRLLGSGLDTAPPAAQDPTDFGGSELLGRLERMGIFYATFLPGEIGLYEYFGPKAAVYCFSLAVGVLCVTGVVSLLRRGQRLIPVCWLIYQGALLLWPAPDRRFYLPLLPLFLCLCWLGAREAVGWLVRRSELLACAAAAVMLIFPAVSIFGALLLAGVKNPEGTTFVEWVAGGLLAVGVVSWAALGGQEEPAAGKPSVLSKRLLAVTVAVVLGAAAVRSVCENVVPERARGPAPIGKGWDDFYEAAVWLKDHSPPDKTVMSDRLSLVWFWSGLQGVRIPRTADRAAAARELAKADWAILDGLYEDEIAERYLKPLLAADSGRWRLRWQKNETRVLQREGRMSQP